MVSIAHEPVGDRRGGGPFISQWGHNLFVPDIAASGSSNNARPEATDGLHGPATPEVKGHSYRLLGFRNPAEVKIRFDHPNLHFSVQKTTNREQALKSLLRELEGEKRPDLLQHL